MAVYATEAEKRNDSRSTAELIGIGVNDSDVDKAWQAITVLHYRATREVLAAAEKLSTGSEKERRVAADITGQLGVPDRAFPQECFDLLEKMLKTESAPAVLSSIGVAFGHLGDSRAIGLLVPMASHRDADARFGAVFGLMGHDSPEAIQTLIKLSGDPDGTVRDWATFALGTQTKADSEEIREALFARIANNDPCALEEALVGLALRGDERIIFPLVKALSGDKVSGLVIEAAEAIADSRLYPALVALRKTLPRTEFDSEVLEDAIARCAPADLKNK